MRTYTPEFMYQMENLLNIGIALSAEKNHTKLLEMILTEARKITRADAGTLFLCEGEQVVFKIMHNETLGIFKGGAGETIDLPPVTLDPSIVTGYVALTKKSVNIPDVNNYQGFDFSGPRRYDKLTGYKSISMLVTPLENHDGELVGVLQLINAKDEEGKVIPFPLYLEKAVFSLASQAAIAISNMQYIDDIEKLLSSFVEVMATTIDARSPYNANHTRRVVQMAERFVLIINEIQEGPLASEYFSEDRQKQLQMAAWLHDIGKIVTPSRVMDKATRLEERLELVLQRFDYIAAWTRLRALESSAGDVEAELAAVQRARDLVIHANNPVTYISDEIVQELEQIATQTYVDSLGNSLPWLVSEEVRALSVRYGTLTPVERKVMEDHVEITRRILEVIPFPKRLKDVPAWAALHHEYLDGSGYPQHLQGNEIPIEGRILTLLDIFDALTAADRPYKKAMPVEEAVDILHGMVERGKIDAILFQTFCQYRVYDCLTEKG